MNFLVKNIDNKKIVRDIIVLSLLATVFICCCTLYASINNIILPILCSILLVISLILFKGKYSLYSFAFAMPFVKFFSHDSLKFGSLFTYIVIFYSVTILFIKIIGGDPSLKKDAKRFVLLVFLSAYILLISVIGSKLVGFIKSVSVIGYLLFFLALFMRKNQNIDRLFGVLLVSFFLANCIGVIIIFLIKGSIAESFISRFFSEVYLNQYKLTNSSFRYPGLSGDPNYLGLFALLFLSFYVVYRKQFRFKYLYLAITIGIQFFALIGQSKNYLFGLFLIVAVIFIRSLLFSKQKFLVIALVIFSLTVFMFVASFAPLSSSIQRLFNIDARNGFLNAITTGRIRLQQGYLSEFISNPSVLFFGHGVGYGSLDGGNSGHSNIIMGIWYFGLLGFGIYLLYFFSFLRNTFWKSSKILLPLAIILFYSLSLEFLISSEMFYLIFFIFVALQDKAQSNVIGEIKYEAITI